MATSERRIPGAFPKAGWLSSSRCPCLKNAQTLAEIAFRAVGTSVINYPAFEMTAEIETPVYSAVILEAFVVERHSDTLKNMGLANIGTPSLWKYRFFCAQFLQSESFFLCKNVTVTECVWMGSIPSWGLLRQHPYVMMPQNPTNSHEVQCGKLAFLCGNGANFGPFWGVQWFEDTSIADAAEYY